MGLLFFFFIWHICNSFDRRENYFHLWIIWLSLLWFSFSQPYSAVHGTYRMNALLSVASKRGSIMLTDWLLINRLHLLSIISCSAIFILFSCFYIKSLNIPSRQLIVKVDLLVIYDRVENKLKNLLRNWKSSPLQ